MKFELEESLRGTPDEKLLEDMRRSAKAISKGTIAICRIRGNRKSPSKYYSANN